MRRTETDAAQWEAWTRLWSRLLCPVETCSVCLRVLGEGEVAGFDRSLKYCQACCDALEDETIKYQERATSEEPKAA